MITTNIRKQGGAAIITIPSDILKILNIEIGSTLSLEVTKEGLIAHPVKLKQRVKQHERYTLKELLCGVTPKSMRELQKSTEWAQEGKPVGRELL